MTTKPVRLQRSRKKGYRLESPNGLPIVCVTRPGNFGNPFRAGMSGHDASEAAAIAGRMRCDIEDGPYTAGDAVELYRWWITAVPERLNDPLPPTKLLLAELRGKNLACYCKLGDPCHADVLLELANR